MAMVQYASDNFTRADENPLSDGGKWSAVTGTHPLQLTGNLVKETTANSINEMLFTGISWPADQYSEATLGGSSLTNSYVDLRVRMTTSIDTSYAIESNALAYGVSQTWTFYKVINGAVTSLGNTGSFTPNIGDVIRLQVVGNVLTAFQNGSQIGTQTDGSSAIASGCPGIQIYGNANFGFSSWAGGANANTSPQFVQSAVGWQIGAFGTSLPALTGPVGAGDQIVVWVASIAGHGTCTGCTDNVGNTYNQVYTATLGVQPIFYCFLATNTSLQAGGITITPTKSVGGTYLVSCVFQYSSAISFTFDQATGQSTGSGTKNLFAPTTATLAQAVEVATMFTVEVSSDNQALTPTAGFTLRGHEYGDPALGEWWGSSDMITAATTAISNAGFTGAANWTGNNPVAIALFYAPTYSISGNAGVASATVSYTGTSSGSTTADGSGNYTLSGLSNGSYTITPSLTGYSFSPTNSSQTVSGSNITGVNFTATHLTVATATFSPVAGTYQKAQTVTVSNTNSGLGGFAMYYTTDGSTPTISSTPIANGGTVSISVTTTLKVLSVATGYINSIATGQFNIVQGTGDGLQYGYRFRF